MNAELIRDMAALSGLELPLERAGALIPALEPVFSGDAAMVALRLGTLSPLGMPWTLEAASLETVPLEPALLKTVPPEAERD